MVRRFDKYGTPYDEPPYTEKEQMEMYRSMSMGPRSSFTRPVHPPAAEAARPTKPRRPRGRGPKRR
jgi:hypothetical protein